MITLLEIPSSSPLAFRLTSHFVRILRLPSLSHTTCMRYLCVLRLIMMMVKAASRCPCQG